MKRILFFLVLFLFSAVSFAAFDECRFNFGRQWHNSFNENTDFSGKGLSHLAIWIGDNDNYNQYWEGSMVRAAKKNNLTPVFYAYVIAEYDKDQGFSDCDVGSPNHCTNGAETIRNKWSNIIGRYKSYAQGVAQDFGTSGTTIWLIEPDFFQYSVSGDNHDTRFSQEGGGIPDADLCGKYFNDIVSAIKSALPNAKIAVDISPWLNDNIITWYANFDKSKIDYLFTSGGRTQGDQDRIRGDNNNLLTWAGASAAMGGKKIIADDGYGVGGASNNDYVEWQNVSNLNNRISDGVIGLTIQEPNDSYYTFAAANTISMCGTSVSSSSAGVITPISSSSQTTIAKTQKTLVVDDFEDGDTISLWDGEWAIYNDNDNGGASTVKKSFVSGNSSSKAIQVSYTLNVGSLTYDPFIGLVVATNADGETTENLSTCTSIQYDYKGVAHSFRVESPNITDDAYFELSVSSANSWTTKTVSWNDLAQPTWGISKSLSSIRETVRAFSWQIQSASGSGTLQIDNVKCLGLPEGSSSSSTASSSSSAPSSSSVVSSSSVQSSSSVLSSSSAESSSSVISSSSAASSSSVVVSSEWQSNTQLTVDGNSVVIGQSKEYAEERNVTKNLGALEAGETYKLSFEATEAQGGQPMLLTTTLNSYCSEETTLTAGNTSQVSCTFTANSSAEAILTLHMPGGRWENVTISNFSFEKVVAEKYFVITFESEGNVLQKDSLLSGNMPKYNGVTPTKQSTVQYMYNFKGWTPAISAVTSDAVYTAVFDSTLVRYYVQFLNGENVLQADSLEYGILPSYNATIPTKENSQAYSYSFKGWSPEISAVTSDAVYTAVFDSTLNKYTVTFVDEDGSVLQAAQAYDYGTLAGSIALPKAPEKPSSAETSYTFAGWTPEISDVTADVIYKATYSSTTNSYTIVFVNEGETLQSSDIAYGIIPVYAGVTPTKASSVQYMYNFKGWSPAISAVTSDAVYTAVFDSTLVRYYVQFLNGENVLQADSLEYGILPSYNATIPTKENSQAYSYSFKGWSPEISAVTSDAVYTAVFDSTLNKYTVTFVDEDGSVLQAAQAYDYGTLAGSIALPKAPEKPSSAETSYTFAGWTPEISDVTADVIYKATYSSTTNSYTIVFVNEGETLQSSDIAYGIIPVYAGVTPTKPSSVRYMYNFKGWTPEISAVTSDAVYTAVFDSTLVRYYVQFLNGENVLQADSLEYGILPSYNAAIPTKENSQAYSYSFKGWTPAISAVTSDVVYKAEFDSVAIPVLSSSSSAESSSSAASSSSIFSSSSEEKVIPALVTNCSIEENRLLVSIQPASDGSTWRLQMNVFDALGNKVSVGEEVSGVEMSYVFSLPSIAALEHAQTYYAILALDGKNEQACPSTPSWEVPALELPPMSSEAVSSSSESSSSTESSSSESSGSSELSSSSEIEIPVSSSSIEESSSSVEVSSSSEESSSSEIEISSSSSEEISEISSSSEMLPESSNSCSDENNCVEPVSSSSESLDYIGSKLHSTLALSLNGRTLQIYGAESATIRLFDLQGVPRFAKETIRGVVSLDNLPAGAYIIQVRAGKNTISRRLVLH